VAILGVDISKASFHCCLIDGETRRASKFDNKSVGYRRVLKWLKAEGADDVHACMEATGPYWRGLANSLSAAGLRVSVVNPSRTAHYARSQLRRTKTDAVDAEMLADFCRSQKPDVWKPPAPEILKLRAFLTYRKQLVKQQTAQNLAIAGIESNGALRRIHRVQLRAIAKAIEAVDRELRSFVKQYPGLRESVAQVQSIPGIGTLSAATIVAHLPVNRLRDKKAVGAYAGLSPSERQSGTSLHGKPRICKTGNAELRGAMYMPAIVAIQCNPTMKAFAARLKARGKPPKVIIVAVMRKMLVLAYTLLMNETNFDPTRA
jgi:transposase